MIIGLTGLIGTGKSTVATMLGRMHCAVFDADKTVHELYSEKEVQDQLLQVFGEPKTRNEIMNFVAQNPAQKITLENILHPLVQARRMAFIDAHKDRTRVLDIPLLFETGADRLCDVVWVTHCDAQTQKERVLARPGFTLKKLNTILGWQTDHRARADLVINTNISLETLEMTLRDALEKLHA